MLDENPDAVSYYTSSHALTAASVGIILEGIFLFRFLYSLTYHYPTLGKNVLDIDKVLYVRTYLYTYTITRRKGLVLKLAGV